MGLRVPYFRIQFGKRDDLPVYSTSQPYAYGIATSPEEEDDENLLGTIKDVNHYVKSVTVIETMDGPEQFEIRIEDRDMRFMFNEALFLSRKTYVDMGMYVDGELRIIPKAEGFIYAMEYEFPDSGVPNLLLKGFGLAWAVLDRDTSIFDITIDSSPAQQEYNISAVPGSWYLPSQGNFPSVVAMLKEVARAFDLEVKEGVTIPWDIQMKVYGKEVDGQSNHIALPCGGPWTWNMFLNKLASSLGCVYFPKGRYLHFHPASWVTATVQTYAELQRNREMCVEAKDKAEKVGDTSLADAYTSRIKDIDKELSTAKAVAEETKEENLYKFDYKCGNFNMLSFKPKLTDLNTSGYLGMAIDPTSGKISFAQTQTSEDVGNYAKTYKTKTEKENDKDIEYATQDKRPDYVTKLGTYGKIQREEIKLKENAKQRIVAPQGPRNNMEMKGITEGSFQNWMWFVEGEATIIGDIGLTCGIPVFTRGLGYQKDSGKVCGKWYIFKITHRISADKDYICDVEMKRYWQYLTDFNKPSESEEQKQLSQQVTEIGPNGKTGSTYWRDMITGKRIASSKGG